MPDDPGPRPRPSRRARWVAPAVVLGLAAVFAVALRIPSAGSSPTEPAASVLTASAVTTAMPSAPPDARPDVGPELKPSDAAAVSSCRHRTIRVLQFNIHYGVSRAGAEDTAQLAAEINAVRPDLVSLNEVDSGTMRSGGIQEAGVLADATGLHAVYGPNLLWDGGVFGNAILTRYPVVEAHNLRLPGMAGLEPRGMLTATVRVGGRDVSFSSMHLSDGDEGRLSRTMQAEGVADFLRQATKPTIVAGDLNSRPDTLPLRIIRQYLLDAQEQGGVGTGDTIPETAPQSRIDYVLYDDHLAVVPGSTRALPSASSDHRSVFTELALRPQYGC